MWRTTDLGHITGPDSVNRTDLRWGIAGTDLGIMWDNGHDAICIAFGDTYHPRTVTNGAGGKDWRHNTLGFITDRNLTKGLRIDYFAADRAGHAKQIIPDCDCPGCPRPEVTTIPTSACRIGTRQYMTYMSVREWGQPGVWKTNFAGIAYSDDGGLNWTKDPHAWWPNTPSWDQQWQLCCLVPHGKHVYLFGTQNGRFGPAKLARAPKHHLLDLDTHEQWDGATWGKNPDAAAVVLDGHVAELSIAWHEPTSQWLALHLVHEEQRIVLRTAREVTGPWTPPVTVVTGEQYPDLYGGFWHPWTMNTHQPCFSLSQWGPYNTRLVQLHLDVNSAQCETAGLVS